MKKIYQAPSVKLVFTSKDIVTASLTDDVQDFNLGWVTNG